MDAPETADAGGADDLSDPEVVGRLVIRVRRLADVSQRELAALVGVAPSTIARIEVGQGPPTVALLSRILGAAGLRLAAVGPQGAIAEPVPSAGVRDNAGRRFPAHLDVDPPDQRPYETVSRPRYDRPPAKGWYHLRPERDRQVAEVPHRERQEDHPTIDELALRGRLMRGRQPWVDAPPRAEVECTCPDACFQELCVPACACRCEAPTLLQTVLRQRQGPPPTTPPT